MDRATHAEKEGYYREINELVEAHRRGDTTQKRQATVDLKALLIREWTAEAIAACCKSDAEALEIVCGVLNRFIDDDDSDDGF